MDAYGIFQGGGAKGYAHVGALKASEQRGIHFIQIAGTSAGAIIASLVAAGYTADELLDPTKPFGQRGILDVAISDILDANDYQRFQRLQRRYLGFGRPQRPKAGLAGSWQQAKRRWKSLIFLRALKALVLESSSLAHIYRRLGAVGTEPVVDWLDNLLRAKVGSTSPVTFVDLNMRLRMVAANVTTGRVQRFGFKGDEDQPVAAAAVASACFPFFFQPLLSGSDMFVDGGLVSNLPVWLFDDERDDDVSFLPTFGFRLVNDALVAKEDTAPVHFLPYGLRMFQTLSSGARNLEERRIDKYHGIDLRARIGTLSFEEARRDAPRLVLEAQASVEEYFVRQVGPQDPERLERVLALVVEMLAEHFEWRGVRVRAHVLIPEDDGHHARTAYGCNMKRDADDHLRVRTDVDGVGAVFRLREPVYITPRPRHELGPGALKYELSARPGEVAGLYAIPMFENGSDWEIENPAMRAAPFAALVLDSEEDFAAIAVDTEEQDNLANVAAIVGEEIRDRAIIRVPRGPSILETSQGWDRTLSAPGIRVAERKVRDPGYGELGDRIWSALARLRDGKG